MQLLLIIAVLAAIAAAQAAGDTPVSHPGARAFGVLMGTLFVGGAAWLVARRFTKLWREPQLARAEWLRRLDRAQALHTGLWLLVVLLTMFGLDWPTLVRMNWRLASWPLVDDVCLLVPVVMPLLLSWAAFYQIELAIADQEPSSAREPDSVAGHLLWQSRQHLATLLLPALLLLGIEDVLRLTAPQLLDDHQAWLWAAPALLALLVGFPFLLRWLWPTEEMPAGPLRTRLEVVLSQQGQQVRNIFVWKTHGRMVNAAVAGCVRRWRYIFLTDHLLEQFSEEQVAAVVAHELGHLRGRHLQLRVLAMIVPALFLTAIGSLLPDTVLPGISQIPAMQQATLVANWTAGFSLAELLFPLAMIVYAATVLGRYSRLLELEADWLACCPVQTPDATELAGRMSPQQTESFLSTLARLAATGDASPDRATWLHPALTTRARFLLSLLHDPHAQTRFARHLRRVRYLLFTACGLGVVLNLLVG